MLILEDLYYYWVLCQEEYKKAEKLYHEILDLLLRLTAQKCKSRHKIALWESWIKTARRNFMTMDKKIRDTMSMEDFLIKFYSKVNAENKRLQKLNEAEQT